MPVSDFVFVLHFLSVVKQEKHCCVLRNMKNQSSFLQLTSCSAYVTSSVAAVFCPDIQGHRRRFLQPRLLITSMIAVSVWRTHTAWPLKAGPLIPGTSSLLHRRTVPVVQNHECPVLKHRFLLTCFPVLRTFSPRVSVSSLYSMTCCFSDALANTLNFHSILFFFFKQTHLADS